MDDAENLKKQLKPLDDITDKVGKLTGDFDDVEKSGASTGVEVVMDLEQVDRNI